MTKVISTIHHVTTYLISHSNFDFHSNLFRLFIFICATIILSALINFFLGNSILGQSYRIFVAPGIVVHEFSHALICFLTGAKVTKISLFDKEGGSVHHQPSKLPVIGPLLISFAPFIFGVALIILFAHWLGIKSSNITTLQPDVNSILRFIKSLIHQINFHSPSNWLILYLTLSIVVTMTPSRQDILNIAFLLVIIVAVSFYLLQFTKLRLNLSFLPFDKIFTLLTLVGVLLILSLVLSIVIFAISKVVKK